MNNTEILLWILLVAGLILAWIALYLSKKIQALKMFMGRPVDLTNEDFIRLAQSLGSLNIDQRIYLLSLMVGNHVKVLVEKRGDYLAIVGCGQIPAEPEQDAQAGLEDLTG